MMTREIKQRAVAGPNECPRCGNPRPCKCSGAAGGGATDNENTKDKADQTESMLKQAMIPGVSIAYSQENQISTLAAGVTDISTSAPVDEMTMFQAASLSKPVSAAIILDLVERGLWDLDKPLSDYEDYAQYAMHPESFKNQPHYNKLTTRMVLAQSSGLPNWFSEGDGEKFLAEPGKQFTYSGVAYYFLQKVIESKLGKSWESLSQEFFAKVGMTHSTFEKPELGALKNARVARGHAGNTTPDPVPTSTGSAVVPAGSLLTTGKDYAAFMQYCLTNPYLKSTLFAPHTQLDKEALLKTPEAAASIIWGLGMAVFKTDGREIGFHWGNNTNSHAFCAIDLKSGDTVACFVNSNNGPNVFQPIAESIVGDLTPVFQLLSTYSCFNAETPCNEKITSPIPTNARNNASEKVELEKYSRYMSHTHCSFFKVRDQDTKAQGQDTQKSDIPPVAPGTLSA